MSSHCSSVLCSPWPPVIKPAFSLRFPMVPCLPTVLQSYVPLGPCHPTSLQPYVPHGPISSHRPTVFGSPWPHVIPSAIRLRFPEVQRHSPLLAACLFADSEKQLQELQITNRHGNRCFPKMQKNNQNQEHNSKNKEDNCAVQPFSHHYLWQRILVNKSISPNMEIRLETTEMWFHRITLHIS